MSWALAGQFATVAAVSAMVTWAVARRGYVNPFADVREFHKTFCPEQVGKYPCTPWSDIQQLRERLIDEEYAELKQAMARYDVVAIADAIFDLIVVLVGTAVAFGIDMIPLWRIGHRSNMAKAMPDGSVRRRADGKVLKPDDWRAPDFAAELERQRG